MATAMDLSCSQPWSPCYLLHSFIVAIVTVYWMISFGTEAMDFTMFSAMVTLLFTAFILTGYSDCLLDDFIEE